MTALPVASCPVSTRRKLRTLHPRDLSRDLWPRLPSRLVPVSFVDPRSPVGGALRAFDELALRPVPKRPTIGLLANGFPDSAAFLDALGTEIAAVVEGASFERVTKVSPPTPLTEEQLTQLSSCHAVIAAYGH